MIPEKVFYDSRWLLGWQAKYCIGDFIEINSKKKKKNEFDFAEKNKYRKDVKDGMLI